MDPTHTYHVPNRTEHSKNQRTTSNNHKTNQKQKTKTEQTKIILGNTPKTQTQQHKTKIIQKQTQQPQQKQKQKHKQQQQQQQQTTTTTTTKNAKDISFHTPRTNKPPPSSNNGKPIKSHHNADTLQNTHSLTHPHVPPHKHTPNAQHQQQTHEAIQALLTTQLIKRNHLPNPKPKTKPPILMIPYSSRLIDHLQLASLFTHEMLALLPTALYDHLTQTRIYHTYTKRLCSTLGNHPD